MSDFRLSDTMSKKQLFAAGHTRNGRTDRSKSRRGFLRALTPLLWFVVLMLIVPCGCSRCNRESPLDKKSKDVSKNEAKQDTTKPRDASSDSTSKKSAADNAENKNSRLNEDASKTKNESNKDGKPNQPKAGTKEGAPAGGDQVGGKSDPFGSSADGGSSNDSGTPRPLGSDPFASPSNSAPPDNGRNKTVRDKQAQLAVSRATRLLAEAKQKQSNGDTAGAFALAQQAWKEVSEFTSYPQGRTISNQALKDAGSYAANVPQNKYDLKQARLAASRATKLLVDAKKMQSRNNTTRAFSLAQQAWQEANKFASDSQCRAIANQALKDAGAYAIVLDKASGSRNIPNNKRRTIK